MNKLNLFGTGFRIDRRESNYIQKSDLAKKERQNINGEYALCQKSLH
jgi:hypothetical protein